MTVGSNVLTTGGPVLVLLVFLGVAGLVLFMERLLFLHRGQIRAREFLAGIENLLGKGRLAEALTVCEETPGPVAVLVKAALLRPELPEPEIRAALEETARIEIPLLERRLGSIHALGQIGPLLGLLGTVLGWIGALGGYLGGGDFATFSEVAGGLWQALWSTAAGLVVAIGARAGGHFLVGRVRAITRDLEWTAQEVVRLHARLGRVGGGGPDAGTLV